MHESDVLKLLARDVRGDTLEFLTTSTSGNLMWTPDGTSNHVLWHAGHALWLQDLMCVEPITGRSELPPEWADRFGMDSQPQTVSTWPPHSEIEELLVSQLDRILDLLDDVTNSALSAPVPRLGGKRTLCGWIIHGLHDEAKHSGEMHLLRKMAKGKSR
jgi:hypothetical protein